MAEKEKAQRIRLVYTGRRINGSKLCYTYKDIDKLGEDDLFLFGSKLSGSGGVCSIVSAEREGDAFRNSNFDGWYNGEYMNTIQIISRTNEEEITLRRMQKKKAPDYMDDIATRIAKDYKKLKWQEREAFWRCLRSITETKCNSKHTKFD